MQQLMHRQQQHHIDTIFLVLRCLLHACSYLFVPMIQCKMMIISIKWWSSLECYSQISYQHSLLFIAHIYIQHSVATRLFIVRPFIVTKCDVIVIIPKQSVVLITYRSDNSTNKYVLRKQQKTEKLEWLMNGTANSF